MVGVHAPFVGRTDGRGRWWWSKGKAKTGIAVQTVHVAIPGPKWATHFYKRQVNQKRHIDGNVLRLPECVAPHENVLLILYVCVHNILYILIDKHGNGLQEYTAKAPPRSGYVEVIR